MGARGGLRRQSLSGACQSSTAELEGERPRRCGGSCWTASRRDSAGGARPPPARFRVSGIVIRLVAWPCCQAPPHPGRIRSRSAKRLTGTSFRAGRHGAPGHGARPACSGWAFGHRTPLAAEASPTRAHEGAGARPAFTWPSVTAPFAHGKDGRCPTPRLNLELAPGRAPRATSRRRARRPGLTTLLRKWPQQVPSMCRGSSLATHWWMTPRRLQRYLHCPRRFLDDRGHLNLVAVRASCSIPRRRVVRLAGSRMPVTAGYA
mmetsp:Transcript_83858/g.233990  ORF Transcript_83858/g.233990 Transcript_83858/m.233990 type:complete len:262 (+) Transcript_83858:185-970(+)